MQKVKEHVERASPDVIIELDSDHFDNFFYDNVPAFCVSLAEEAEGPQEIWCPMPHYVVKGHVPMARGVLSYGIDAHFDLAAAEELRLDHSVMVPLHYLNPGMALPVIPLYVNGFAAPTPTAERCFALGRMVRDFLDQWPGDERVALIASGCFAMDVGGPLRGWTDEEWVEAVSGWILSGQHRELSTHATAERMAAAATPYGT
jgi:hypothetical protein